LFVGGRYIQERGFSVREIEVIHGDDIHWRDQVGDGQCSRKSFYRWLGRGSLASDSPPPPQMVARRPKRITEEAIECVRSNVAALRNLGEINIGPGIDGRGLISIGLWALKSSLHRMQDVELPGHNRMRTFTRIDADAQLVQSAIISLRDVLESGSEGLPAEGVSPLLQALSDGLESANRLRDSLVPYLGQ
jgi:hypothetical protein